MQQKKTTYLINCPYCGFDFRTQTNSSLNNYLHLRFCNKISVSPKPPKAPKRIHRITRYFKKNKKK